MNRYYKMECGGSIEALQQISNNVITIYQFNYDNCKIKILD